MNCDAVSLICCELVFGFFFFSPFIDHALNVPCVLEKVIGEEDCTKELEEESGDGIVGQIIQSN